MTIYWMLLKRIALWKPADLDCISQKDDDVFKKLNFMRILSVDDLPQNCKNKTGEIVFNAYWISISEIASSCTSKGNGALFFISGYTLVNLWGRDCFSIFDSHSRDSSGRRVVNGTAVLLNFLSLHHMDGYIKKPTFNIIKILCIFKFHLFRLRDVSQSRQFKCLSTTWIMKNGYVKLSK